MTRAAANPRGTLRRVLGGLAGLALLALAWSRVDVDALAVLGRELRWSWLVVAVALVPLQVALAAWRWRVVSEALDQPLGFVSALREYALSTFLNLVLPFGVAGDAVRVWRRRGAHGVGAAARAAIVERWSGQAVLAVGAAGGVLGWPLLAPAIPRPAGVSMGVVAALALLAGLLLVPRAAPVVGALAGDARAASAAAPVALVGLGVGLLAAILAGFQACAFALGRPLGVELALGVPLVLLAAAIPLGFAGWGPRELGAVGVLPLFGWSATEAFALTGLVGLTFLAGALPGAIVLVTGQRDG